jgi:hypothetical protein
VDPISGIGSNSGWKTNSDELKSVAPALPEIPEAKCTAPLIAVTPG